jgi:hypothetical protein
MKKKRQHKLLRVYLFGLLLSLLAGQSQITAQDKEEAVPVKKYVTLKYFNEENQQQYLILSAIAKSSEGVIPQQNKIFSIYLDTNDPANLIATVTTDETGAAKAFIPPTLKTIWDASAKHSFLAVADAGTDTEQSQEIEIVKSKISIDTINEDGARSITARVMKLEGSDWVPAADVEMKLGILRMGKVLSAGDELTYTTDSSGIATVQLSKKSLPGDVNGNYILAAKVEDNDELGNLLAEKTVGWGVPEKIDKTFFDQRTLWTTRNRTPGWLLFIAYSIVIGVWGTLIYLFFQIRKIKQLGKNTSTINTE